MNSRRVSRRHALSGSVLVSVCASVLALAGCGSTTASTTASSTAPTTSATSGTGTASGSGIAAAKVIVAKYSGVQASLDLSPVTKRPPTGKTVAVVNCTLPTCVPGAGDPAYKKLGWKVIEVPFDVTKGPAAYGAAFEAALQDKPNYISLTAVYPDSIVAKQFAAAKTAGIGISQIGGGYAGEAKYGILGCFICNPANAGVGQVQTDIALADAGTKTGFAYVFDPTVSGSVAAMQGAQAELKKNGDGSSFAPVPVSAGDPPSTTAAKILAYLQSHPYVKYVAASFSEAFTGLPQAMQQAGVSGKVKLIEAYPTEQDLQNISQGKELAAVDHENAAGVWRGIDAFVRQSVGDTGPATFPVGWIQIVNRQTVTTTIPQPLDYQAQFFKAWKLG